MLVRAPYSFLFILAVCCWFRYNAAVPLASHSSNQMQDAFKEKKTDSQSDSDDTSLDSGSMRETKTLEDTSEDDEHDEHEETDEDDENDEISNTSNVNQNMNMNMNTNVFNRGERHRITRNGKRHKQTTTTEDTTTVTEYGTLEEMAREEATNCGNARRMNQRYSSSFYENTTNNALTVEKEFHDVVGNNSKVKKSGSVHEGEDITLCWIEMTTIKEDKTTQPPKRLVIREYTISFENSVTIPERYLECKRYEGELTANDPDIGKTALFEVIDEDTMVSRVVNFTSVNHAGNVTTWQHKKVKCGVGPVVSKNIVELNDGSKNPKKRVEIKVSPKMHQLTATTTEEEPCTESSEETEESSTLTESTEHATALSCENGVCETTVISPSISTKNGKVSTAEETVTKLQGKTESESESEEDYSLPPVTKSLTLPDEEVSRRSTTFPKISTTIQEYQEKIDCEENSSDPACLTEKYSKYDTPSPGQLFPELSAEVSTTEAETSIPIGRDKEITAKEEGRLKETTQSSFTSREEKKVTFDLVTEETIVTDISMESTEARGSQSTDQVSVDDSSTISLETKIMTSEEIDKIDHVPSSSKVTSKVTSGKVETEPDITTAIPVEFIEFTKGPDKPGQGLDKLSESPISTESVTGPIIIESSSTSEEVPSEESEESKTSAIEGTTFVGSKTSSEGKFVSMSTKTLPKEIRSTTLSPAISSEVDHSCENSEECEHIASSEACDASGNCGETTTRCNSGECSKEGITEDQSKFDTSPPLIMTKVPSSATSSLSSEESGMIETQHTTVANVATTMLTSRENTSTAVNIPVTMDTRRSTTTSTPRHKLTLKVKVLLEHINENKEKQNLVEVEKHLSLNENPGQHDNLELLEQLKSLNDSVNMETISALLNCTSLGNLTRDSNFVSGEPGDAVDGNDEELEFSDIDPEDSISKQFASGYADAKSDYLEYEEHEVSSRRRRRRRSLVNPMKELNRFVRRNLYDPTDPVVDSFNTSLNVSKSQQTELTKDNLQLSTTTNYTEEGTTENERNTTKERDENTTTLPSTTVSIIDLSNASESHEANLTKENIQLTTTIKPEEETSNGVYIESEKNITNERNESARSLTKENISNKTKMEVVRETLPGIQQDVVVGLQHMVSQLAHGNLTSINNIPEAVKTNLLGILADPKDTRVHSRRRRAAAEEVGHWSNERIKEAPMGGNLRSLTEFTLYKVVP